MSKKISLNNKIILLISALLLIILVFYFKFYIYPKYKKVYYAEDFDIVVEKSKNDTNNNGIDDYTDILNGAKKDAKNHPKYHSAYYDGGYPPDNEGVCTDTIWRAFKEAGLDLKSMIDEDITKNIYLYPEVINVQKVQDKNIDFRRVKNLKVFFDRFAIKLSVDPYKIEEWMPGDIVIFSTNHIGIISDKRNKKGVPYIIHNAGQPLREEDALERWNKKSPITGHYRFDYTKYLELKESWLDITKESKMEVVVVWKRKFY